MDYVPLRRKMVETQLAPRGIKDKKVLDAFLKVQRDKFIPENLRQSAYEDFPVSIGEGQTISQPYIVALMTELLGLTGSEKVLEIGTGSGYQTAILAELSKEVYSVERLGPLSAHAKTVLDELGYKNINLKVGDGSLGWPEEAPFDRVIITAASPRIPLPLPEQLKDGALLVAPLGEGFSQTLTLVKKDGAHLRTKNICGCIFVPLIGKYGRNQDA